MFRRTILHDAPPQSPPPLAPTNRSSLWREIDALAQVPRLVAASRRLSQVPRGRAQVVAVPGFAAPEATLAPLSAYLRMLGHEVSPWGLGRNRGKPEADLERLLPKLEERAARSDRPLVLIGWSLGGLIAREAARRRPDLIMGVASYGAPIIGGPTYTIAAGYFGRRECARISQLQQELDVDSPILVPAAVVFTKRDRVVSWSACIDHTSPRAEHIEVSSGHTGMGLDPDVWEAIAQRLAQWAPERPRA